MAIPFGGRQIHTLDEIDVQGKSIFYRVDLNAPLDGERVADDTRLRAILPTVHQLLQQGARLVLASHLGRPKGKVNVKYSLLPVAERLAELLKREVTLPDDCVGDGVRKVLRDQKLNDVVLLENVRFHAGEIENDEAFARQLQHGLDVYVSDAFGALHRAHASVHVLPSLFQERAAGLLVEKELRALQPLLTEPTRPYAVVLGGVKVSDKVKVIESLLRRVDQIFLGGAMVFTFLRAMGKKTGKSLVEEDRIGYAERILRHAEERRVKIILPDDFALGRSIDDPGEMKISTGLDIPGGWMGLDIGPVTVQSYSARLAKAKTIFWNGPMGLFEKSPFDAGTVGIARALGEMESVRVIGGGDSAAAVSRAGVADRMTHISTGGGATLEHLEGRALPGLEALAV